MRKEEVEKVIEEMRPQIQLDGGDVELISIDEDKGLVKIKFKGACVGCPLSYITLGAGISKELSKKVKGFKDIEAIEEYAED